MSPAWSHLDDEAFLDGLPWAAGADCRSCPAGGEPTVAVMILRTGPWVLCRTHLTDKMWWARQASTSPGYQPADAIQVAR